MTSENLQRTTYRDPTSPGNPVRAGSPTRAENALDMDQYYRPLERMHGTSLHGWGVASGLSVSASLNSPNTTITVLPGVALDSNGQHISLAVGGNAEIGPSADAPGANPTLAPVAVTGVSLPVPATASGDKYLTIQFWETFDSDGFQNLGTFRYFHTPWLRLLNVAGFVNDGTRLVLAKVSLGTGATAGQVTALVADVRQGTDLPVGSIHLLKSATSVAASVESVQAAEAGVIRAYGSGGIDVTVPNPSDEVHLERDDGGNFAKVSLGAEKIVARQGNGTTESVVIDTEVGSITASGPISAASITASADIAATTGIRQNRLHMSGGVGGSSITYNAYRNDDNSAWVFPDPSHSAVTLEMDDAVGTPRFQVWSTTPGNPTGWVERFAIDGNSGDVSIAPNGGNVSTSNIAASGSIETPALIRQNQLYMSGGVGWSSLSYNAHHNDANNAWVFPDPSRTAVTIEMDDAGGTPRFQVWSTTPGNPTGWVERFAIDGNSGNTWVGGNLSFAGNLFGKYGDASRAHSAWLFAQNSIAAVDISLPYAQPLFAFIALTSINHFQVQPSGTGNFAYITGVDGGDPFGRPIGDPANSVWSGTAQTISFRLQSTVDSQAWAVAVVFPQQG